MARCAAFIAALICILSTTVCADGLEEYIYQTNIVNQNFNYFERADGTTLTGSYLEYTVYRADNYPEQDYLDKPQLYGYDYVYMRRGAGATGNPIKYIYLPVFMACGVQIELYTASSSNAVKAYQITAVDAIKNGVTTSCEFTQSEASSEGVQLIRYEEYPSVSDDTTALWIRRLSVNVPKSVDILRLEISTTSVGNISIGVFEQTPIPNGAEITEGINNIISTINNQSQSIVNTIIKYGDDANYYLEAITYSTEDQKLIVNTTKQKFNTALQALQAQNQIIHSNVINNAPTQNQVQQVINKEQIAPDVDVAVIGGGTSDSGIGIIMSQTKVIAMMVLVMGIAILSYLLFGRKT